MILANINYPSQHIILVKMAGINHFLIKIDKFRLLYELYCTHAHMLYYFYFVLINLRIPYLCT